MISKEKLALIHVGKKELGLTDPEYREILRHHGQVESAADLDEDGFKKVIDHMKALGFWVKRRFEQTRPRDPGDLPTPGQLKVIKHLWDDFAEYVGGAKQVPFRRGFYEQRLKIPALGPQTRAQANTVIEALKRRVHSEMRKALTAPATPIQTPPSAPLLNGPNGPLE